MRKVIFALFCFFSWEMVFASSTYLVSMEPMNGSLLTPFRSQNNVYTIRLNEDASKLEFQYEIEDKEASVLIFGGEYVEGQENKLVIQIQDETSKDIQEYVFYLEKENSQNVISNQELATSLELKKKKPIPHLKFIVISICLMFILVLFKFLVINYFLKGRKKDHLHKN